MLCGYLLISLVHLIYWFVSGSTDAQEQWSRLFRVNKTLSDFNKTVSDVNKTLSDFNKTVSDVN